MRIAYVQGMEKIAASLTEFGHELVPIERCSACDAVLCDEAMPPVSPQQEGALYLMAKQKTAAQLNVQLKARLYTQLFER